MTDQESSETLRGTSTTKRFVYDADDERVGMASGTQDFSLTRDPHDDISTLVADDGSVTASYAYKPYGDLDMSISRGDVDKTNTFNGFRFDDKRFDSGSRSIEMAVRRYDPDDGRFLEQDYSANAGADLDLSTEPLSANREGFAGGSPVMYRETNGHWPVLPDFGFLTRPKCAAKPGYPLGRIGEWNGGVAAHTAKAPAGAPWESKNALDLNVPYGTKVCAVFRGRLVPRMGYGGTDHFGGSDIPQEGLRMHLVRRGGGEIAFYQHNSKLRFWPKPGSVVIRHKIRKGELIGYSGCDIGGTPHLHIALLHGNPEKQFTSIRPPRSRRCKLPPYPEPWQRR
jgi:RHS repeat-associated protein